jgi:hypothetical protein
MALSASKRTDLNANVEGNQVDKQAIGRDFEFLDFGCQTKPWRIKDERRKLRVGLNAKPRWNAPRLSSFIDHGQPDNGVNNRGTDADIKEGADEQRR